MYVAISIRVSLKVEFSLFLVVDSGMMLCESTEAYHCAVFNPVEPRLVAVCNSYNGTALYDTRQKKR